MVLPVQDAKQMPWLFTSSINLTFIAAFAWLVISLGNDYAHWRYGLLRPQNPRTVLIMVLVGTLVAAGRLLHLWLGGQLFSVELSTEWLHRLVLGVPYFVLRRFGLDMWGWAICIGIHRISAMDWEFETPANPSFFEKSLTILFLLG